MEEEKTLFTENITDKVLQTVEAIQQKKRGARRVPDHALVIRDGLYAKVSEYLTPEGFQKVLQRLADEGTIEYGNTINDTYVRIVGSKRNLI